MIAAAFLRVTVVETLLRMLPFPCRTGLVRIGDPGRDAPVLLTGNFRLTVERVKRALRGLDVWLLVANSRGVNVWCAATGGLLTNHDVISVLKTSGIGELVDHRRVVLPQLAATGIEGAVVRARTEWRTVWGPVEAADIPAFLEGGMTTTAAMRTVRFPAARRLEMAVAWAFPLSLAASLILLFLWPAGLMPVPALVWALALALFLSFPLYRSFLRPRGKGIGLVFLDFGRYGLPLVLWVAGMAVLAGLAGWAHALPWPTVARFGGASFVVLLVLGLDLAGSTPVLKSGLHADRMLRITLDEERCKGAAICERVCPTDVFVVDPARRMATLPRAGQCVQCGACIVQCPFDALHFTGPRGEVVTPDTVRRYKLNLLGRRAVPGGPRTRS